MSASAQEFPELACYGLAGHSSSPRDLVDEVRHAERLGLGSVFLSERFNVKDAAVMAGVAAGVSERIGIATAATNHNTRHPLVTATLAMTAHRVSEGRYALGLGRGFGVLFDLMGVPQVTVLPAVAVGVLTPIASAPGQLPATLLQVAPEASDTISVVGMLLLLIGAAALTARELVRVHRRGGPARIDYGVAHGAIYLLALVVLWLIALPQTLDGGPLVGSLPYVLLCVVVSAAVLVVSARARPAAVAAPGGATSARHEEVSA